MSNPSGTGPLPGQPLSLWMVETPARAHAPLGGPVETDVVVLGAGIVGVTTAVRLLEAGLRVVLLDAREILSGATGHTTAKITALHGLKYRALQKSVGAGRARAHASAQTWALESLRSEARERGILCDLETCGAYTYAESAEELKLVEEEVEAARAAGLDARLTSELDLPFPVEGAVALEGQARFHPRKYLLGLLNSAPRERLSVHERTTALEITAGDPCVVRTDRGEVRATWVVVATQQPFSAAGGYYAKLATRRSFALAVRLAGPVPRGMYISVSDDFRSMRPQPVGGEDVLIVGGGRHATGQAPDTTPLVRDLEAWARERFDVRDILFRWATHDYVTHDGLPLVGRVEEGSPRVLMATGFGGWGMTNGTVAGHLLADLVLERANVWAELYSPARTGLGSGVAGLVQDAVRTVKDLVGAFDPPAEEVESLAPGEGRVISWGYDKLAAYRDDAGKLHRVSAVCPHMQCVVRWNSAERSWDCPCHGSRFDVDGRVLHGPATEPLAPDVA